MKRRLDTSGFATLSAATQRQEPSPGAPECRRFRDLFRGYTTRT